MGTNDVTNFLGASKMHQNFLENVITIIKEVIALSSQTIESKKLVYN